jgi:hypothetical protein
MEAEPGVKVGSAIPNSVTDSEVREVVPSDRAPDYQRTGGEAEKLGGLFRRQ